MKATTKKRLLAIGLCTPAALALTGGGSAFAQAQRPARGGAATPPAPPSPPARTPAAPAPPAAVPSSPASSSANAANATSAGTLGSTTPGPKGTADPGALPQFEKGMEFTPLSPNNKVTFSMEDADLSELVRTIAQITGKRFIFGGKVRTIKASVYSPEKVTVAEAYQAFLSILETNGLTVVPHGRFLKIVEVAGHRLAGDADLRAGRAAPAGGPLRHPASPPRSRERRRHRRRALALQDQGGGHHRLRAGNLLIITDTGANIRRMMKIIEDVDVGNAGDKIWIEPLHYASASDVAKRIAELFDVRPRPRRQRRRRRRATRRYARGGGSGGGSAAAAGRASRAIVADDRSSSLVIVATEPAYLRVLEFIKRIDVPTTGEGEIHVFPLQHADATELAKTLNEIINGAGGAGAGAVRPGRRRGSPSDVRPAAPPRRASSKAA